MKIVTLQLDIKEEIDAMEQQVLASWKNVRDLRPALEDLYARATHDTRAFFEDFEPSTLCHSLIEARAGVIESYFSDEDQKNLCGYYDSISNTLSQINTSLGYVLSATRNMDGPWDFSGKLTPHFKAIVKKYPSLAHATLKTDAESVEFKGSYIGAVRSFEFPERITANHVEAEMDSHGKGSAYALLGAAYAHFMGISEQLNTLRLVRDIKGLFDINEPSMKFGKIIDGSTGNKLLDTLISLGEPMHQEQDFVDAVENAKTFRAKTEEEQKAISAGYFTSNDELDRSINESQKKALKALCRHFRTSSGHDQSISVTP